MNSKNKINTTKSTAIIECPKSVKALNIAIICVASAAVIFMFLMIFAFSAMSEAISNNGGFDNLASVVVGQSSTTTSSTSSNLSTQEQEAQINGGINNSSFTDSLSTFYEFVFNSLWVYFVVCFIMSIAVIVFSSLILYWSRFKKRHKRCVILAWFVLIFSLLSCNLPNFVLSIISLVFVCKNK